MNNTEFLAMLPTVLVGVIVAAVIGAVSSGVRKKTALLSAEGRFEVRHPKAVAIIGLICMLVFAGFLVMSLYAAATQGTLSGRELGMVAGVFGFFFLMGAALLLIGARWRLEAGEDIVYAPALGRVQVVPYAQIGYARQMATKYKVYDNYHRHIFTVEQSCIGGATLLNKLRNHGIPLYRKESLWQVAKFRAAHTGEGREKTYLPRSTRKKRPDAEEQRY